MKHTFMTDKQIKKCARNNQICEAFEKEVRRNSRRSDNVIIGEIMPMFPEIKSPVTFRSILGRAGKLSTQQ